MEIVAHQILKEIKLITPKRHADVRGLFSEIWRENVVIDGNQPVHFVQENQSRSHARGTVRGLHFQIGESAQSKLVRCIRGSLLDVAVDIRHGSPTFGCHVSEVISEENWRQIYIPIGFAHGYCTLKPDTEIIYKVSSYYDAKAERGLVWDDPKLGIEWGVTKDAAIITDRDRNFPTLADLPNYFHCTISSD